MQRHPLDPVSLVFGIAFAALATMALIVDPVQLLEARWLWPGLLIVLGLALLLAPLGGREPVRADDTPDAQTLDGVSDGTDIGTDMATDIGSDVGTEAGYDGAVHDA